MMVMEEIFITLLAPNIALNSVRQMTQVHLEYKSDVFPFSANVISMTNEMRLW